MSFFLLIDIKIFIVTGFIISSPVSLLPSTATENGVAFILSTNFEVRSIANASFKMADDFVLPHSYFFANIAVRHE